MESQIPTIGEPVRIPVCGGVFYDGMLEACVPVRGSDAYDVTIRLLKGERLVGPVRYPASTLAEAKRLQRGVDERRQQAAELRRVAEVERLAEKLATDARRQRELMEERAERKRVRREIASNAYKTSVLPVLRGAGVRRVLIYVHTWDGNIDLFRARYQVVTKRVLDETPRPGFRSYPPGDVPWKGENSEANRKHHGNRVIWGVIYYGEDGKAMEVRGARKSAAESLLHEGYDLGYNDIRDDDGDNA